MLILIRSLFSSRQSGSLFYFASSVYFTEISSSSSSNGGGRDGCCHCNSNNNTPPQYLLSTYSALGSVWSALILTPTLWWIHCYHPYFLEKETEALRGWKTHPGTHSGEQQTRNSHQAIWRCVSSKQHVLLPCWRHIFLWEQLCTNLPWSTHLSASPTQLWPPWRQVVFSYSRCLAGRHHVNVRGVNEPALVSACDSTIRITAAALSCQPLPCPPCARCLMHNFI